MDFGCIGFEEFAASGGVEKQFFHLDLGAVAGQGAGSQRQPFAAAKVDCPSRRRRDAHAFGFIEGGTCGGFHRFTAQCHIRDCADGIKGLAPEPERLDFMQILRVLDLTRGMTRENLFQVLAFDAMAVVFDPDEGPAGLLDLHFDCFGPGIQGIFDEFLDDRGGPLDDLSGGDFADDVGF